MSLISVCFIPFLAVAMVINYILPKKYRYIWLFTISSIFYLSMDVRFFAGLFFCTATTYAAALCFKGEGSLRNKCIVAVCVIANILVLVLFRTSLLQNVLIPIGISFYSLQAIGYVIDVYRKKVEAEKNPIRYALFVSFFPTVTSGPIQRVNGLLSQIREGKDFDDKRARSGLYCLLGGYLLKTLIANPLSGMVNYAYGSYETMPGATLLWATILYAIQLYCDFAGYSALAIGSAKMLGFDMEANFAQPYFAVSVKDFWKRWHISLSSWLRDYVYIPLGGSRKGKCRTYGNLLITFAVSGLWHSFGVTFLIWGMLHGVYNIVESILVHRKSAKNAKKMSLPGRWLKIGITFVFVDFAWLFFRADSLEQALSILHRIFFEFKLSEMTYYGSYLLGGTKTELLFLFLAIAVAFLIDMLHEKQKYVEEISLCIPTIIRWGIYIVLTLLILYVSLRDYGQAASTFIYERF